MSYEYETDTSTPARDDSRVTAAPAVRIRRGRRNLIQRILLAAIAMLVVLAALVFLILTIRSQTTKPSGDKTVDKTAAAPISVAPPGAQPTRPGVAAPIVDEDGDGIDDGVDPNLEIPQPNLREPAAAVPSTNRYTGPYLDPRSAPGTVVRPAAPSAPVLAPPTIEPRASDQPTARPRPDSEIPAPQSGDRPTSPAAKAMVDAPRGPVDGQVRRMADKTFRHEVDGTWVDVAFDPAKQQRVLEVVAGSAEYQRLLATEPQLAAYFRLSDRLVVVLADIVYRVVPKAQ